MTAAPETGPQADAGVPAAVTGSASRPADVGAPGDGDDPVSGVWSRAALRAMAEGAGVFLRDWHGQPVTVPDWLAEPALLVEDRASGDLLELVHPDDRTSATYQFLSCRDVPGTLMETSYRVRLVDGYRPCRFQWLNLIDDELAAVLVIVRDDSGLPISVPSVDPVVREESPAWMVYRVEEDRGMVRVEGRVKELLGYEPHELEGRRLMDIIHPESLAAAVDLWLDVQNHPGESRTARRRFVRADGSTVWLESSYLNRRHPGGEGDIFVVAYDVTERIAQEAALHESREEYKALAEDFRLLADEVPTAVFRCDGEGAILFHNTRWTELVETAVPVTRLRDAVHPDDQKLVDEQLDRVGHDGGQERVTVEVRSAQGDRVFAITCRSVGERDEGWRRIVGSLDDVTSTVQLRRRANHDPLTGLLNRHGLEERLRLALATDPQGTLVYFLDLDGFKEVNDTFGHAAGDEVLVAVARRLARVVRPEDTVARYGGDEFVVVTRGLDDEGAAALPGRLEASLEHPVHFSGGRWDPAVSIGRARPRPGDDPASVVRHADRAMFEIKRSRQGPGPDLGAAAAAAGGAAAAAAAAAAAHAHAGAGLVPCPGPGVRADGAGVEGAPRAADGGRAAHGEPDDGVTAAQERAGRAGGGPLGAGGGG